MPRIKNIEKDVTVTGNDKVLGTDVSGATKNATLQTDVEIQVPLFVNEDELIKVDTRDMTYVGRAKS